MPWKESTCMTQRREFVLLANVPEVNVSQLCNRFGISRKTGYKWRARFAAEGPRDSKGRSLRDFDLTRRMFKYPLSYMIYSPIFDALPASARDAIYRRLWGELSRKDRGDRTAIVEILRATRSGLPAYFRL